MQSNVNSSRPSDKRSADEGSVAAWGERGISQLPNWYRALVLTMVLQGFLAVGSLVMTNLFVLPQVRESYNGWVERLAKTDPNAPAIIAQRPIFKALAVMISISEAVTNWWFVLGPGMAGLILVGGHLLVRLPPTAVLLIVAAGTLVLTTVACLFSSLGGIMAVILIPNLLR